MKSWNLLLPQGVLTIQSREQGAGTVLLVAGGRRPAAAWLLAAAQARTVYCADKGIECCLDNGLLPAILCGDADSAAPAAWQQAQAAGVKILRHDPAKDDTDLQLLLAALPARVNVIASGIWGGRFDHLYSNVFSLLAHKRRQGTQVVLADEQELLVLLQGGESVVFEPSVPEAIEALSLLPLTDCSEVTLQGVQWNLAYSPLLLAHPYAVSNMVRLPRVDCTCHQGSIGFYVKYKV